MSYDIGLSVKAENGQYVEFTAPEYPHPTYNIGEMLRKCMDWDFKQGEYYRVSEILPNIERGIHELTYNRKAYVPMNPPNGWGSVGSALEALESINKCIAEVVQWRELPLEVIYLSW